MFTRETVTCEKTVRSRPAIQPVVFRSIHRVCTIEPVSTPRTTPAQSIKWKKVVLPRNMLKSYPTRYPTREAGTRVIRLTVDQEAVLQEQFNRWPRAPHTADVVLLAAETGLSEADVEGWYAIRLAQWRKEQGLGGNLGLH
ncbi:uncharacterized protein LOC105185061 isoform X1 [Harpegnathos saltator]|nr:uncharacterized protein LOC105185061 isoform X1 [Harpegnathos saltator]